METIYSIILTWETKGIIDRKDAELTLEFIDQFLEKQFEKIGKLTEREPEKALAVVVQTSNFLSAAASKVPRIVIRLQNHITKYQGHLKTLGKKIGAASFTICAGFPSGVSVSLTWNI